MSLIYQGKEIEAVNYNGTALSDIKYNGTTVWEDTKIKFVPNTKKYLWTYISPNDYTHTADTSGMYLGFASDEYEYTYVDTTGTTLYTTRVAPHNEGWTSIILANLNVGDKLHVQGRNYTSISPSTAGVYGYFTNVKSASLLSYTQGVTGSSVSATLNNSNNKYILLVSICHTRDNVNYYAYNISYTNNATLLSSDKQSATQNNFAFALYKYKDGAPTTVSMSVSGNSSANNNMACTTWAFRLTPN